VRLALGKEVRIRMSFFAHLEGFILDVTDSRLYGQLQSRLHFAVRSPHRMILGRARQAGWLL
jgi:hypothetical protein